MKKRNFFEQLDLTGDDTNIKNINYLLIKPFQNSEVVKKETNLILMVSIICDAEWFNKES